MGQSNAALTCIQSTTIDMFLPQQSGHLGASYLDNLTGVSSPQTVGQTCQSSHQLLMSYGSDREFEQSLSIIYQTRSNWSPY